ncbi:unnamed protein product [Boreogadus saida]
MMQPEEQPAMRHEEIEVIRRCMVRRGHLARHCPGAGDVTISHRQYVRSDILASVPPAGPTRNCSPKPAGTGGAAQHPRPPRLRERGYPDPTRTGRRESSDMRLRWAASTAEQRPTPQTALQYKP